MSLDRRESAEVRPLPRARRVVPCPAVKAASMRAALTRGRGQLELEQMPRPEPGRGDVRVRVEACGICGTDLHFYHEGLAVPGRAPGHEIAGFVDALGEGVTGIEIGARVAVEPLRSCGDCRFCAEGRGNICRELRVLGIHEHGGFADYVVAPAGRLFPLPAELPAAIAALAEPVAVVSHGLRRGGFEAGQRVLVLGAGSLGLMALVVARARGAGEVWLSARHSHQAELGRALGAARVLREAEASVEGLDALGRSAPIDLVVETVGGRADTLRAACAAIRPGGAVSVLGLFTGAAAVEPLQLLLKEGTLAWSNCYTHGEPRADFDDAVGLLGSEREALARLVTHQRPLAEIGRAFEEASNKKDGAVKVSVLP